MSRSDFVFYLQAGFEEFVSKANGDKAEARTVGDCCTKHGLNTAVRNACDNAGIARWSPGQHLKTRATQARCDGDLETAQQILGHSSKQTTERHYADVDLSRAKANALQFECCMSGQTNSCRNRTDYQNVHHGLRGWNADDASNGQATSVSSLRSAASESTTDWM